MRGECVSTNICICLRSKYILSTNQHSLHCACIQRSTVCTLISWSHAWLDKPVFRRTLLDAMEHALHPTACLVPFYCTACEKTSTVRQKMRKSERKYKRKKWKLVYWGLLTLMTGPDAQCVFKAHAMKWRCSVVATCPFAACIITFPESAITLDLSTTLQHSGLT